MIICQEKSTESSLSVKSHQIGMHSYFLIKYNENMEKVASIELPLLSQKYGFATHAIVIDETGNIYYMMVRSESITLLIWTQ